MDIFNGAINTITNTSTNKILVQVNNQWLPAREYQAYAFLQFKENNEQDYLYKNDAEDIIFTIARRDGGVYLIREDSNRSPIADWLNVKSLVLHKQVSWTSVPSDDIITKMYFDLMYSNCKNKTFSQHGDYCITLNKYDDGSVSYTNDNNEHVIITDNDPVMKHYLKINKPVGTYNTSSDWFNNAFNFIETDYATTQQTFKRMFLNENKSSLNGIKVGKFTVIDNSTLLTTLKSLSQHNQSRYTYNVVSVENIVDDIVEIHKHKSSAKSTIQVASQLNCLEMVNYNVTPEEGITIYKNDRTQGPICAMSCPASLAYRNYLVFNGLNGQTHDHQIDLSSKFMKYVLSFDDSIKYHVSNGYLLFDSENDLIKTNIVLATPEVRRHAKSLIMVGSHTDSGVFVQFKLYEQTVNHVYCSGLPISYNYGSIRNVDLWDGLAEIFLDAMYENTLIVSCMNNAMNNVDAPCYLTKIGGGVFSMKHSQIINAIQRACQTIADAGIQLDVKIVHYRYVDAGYDDISVSYPDRMLNMNSVWDDPEWVESYAKNMSSI